VADGRRQSGQSESLLGRQRECGLLDGLLDRARGGRSAVVVLRGEPGVGKTALLGYLTGRAAGFNVARCAGVESEMELAFAGLHDLCTPMLDRLDSLVEPQQRARKGRTNPEIGAELFLSVRTVEWHLHNIFNKLEIRSRRELDAALIGRGSVGAAPTTHQPGG
jgi:Bacterial regulatory proteins, luxR family/AAA ATPase domain